jgi:predicted TIM-barrel fold metal-dependent hydrolase
MREQLLDPYNIERAVLGYDVGSEAAHENPYFAAALASAANDWCIDRWVTRDPRLYGLVLVPTQMPEAAAAEVARVGDQPRMVGVLFPDGGVGVPFGHPIYHPIYAAAADRELPIVIHFGMNMWSPAPHLAAGGLPQSHLEFYAALNQAAMHHATSLITHGVFERWPRLRVIILEVGCLWAPWLFAQLDAQYGELRRESPWVKRLPSEYLTDHIRISTQPMEAPDRLDQYLPLLELIDRFDDVLMFSSDYPHWDTDALAFVGRKFPAEWHEKLFYRNAVNAYRWPA